VEVEAEGALPDLLEEVAVRGGDDAGAEGAGPVRAEALEGAVLEDAEQLALQGGRLP
jgi:hypothetical protein